MTDAFVIQYLTYVAFMPCTCPVGTIDKSVSPHTDWAYVRESHYFGFRLGPTQSCLYNNGKRLEPCSALRIRGIVLGAAVTKSFIFAFAYSIFVLSVLLVRRLKNLFFFFLFVFFCFFFVFFFCFLLFFFKK